MEEVKLKVELRKDAGKEAAKRLRRLGTIPAVIYGKGEKTIPIKISARELEKVLHTAAGENVLINLKIAHTKEAGKTVIIKELQHDPVKGDIYHIDFNHISLKEAIEVKVPVTTKGESPGVKEGGVMEHILWELEVECLPTQIPEKFEVDCSNLAIGDAIHVKNLFIPEGIKVLNPPEDVVVSVVPPKAEEEVPVEEEVIEPEVIGKKKEEEEEVPEEAPEEKPKEGKPPKGEAPKKEEKPK